MDNTSVFHSFTKNSSLNGKLIFLAFVVAFLGVASGYGIVWVKNSAIVSSVTSSSTSGKAQIQAGAVYGSNDTTTFKDTAEGVVQKGGIGDEGQYHLVRPGGDSQNVYMTSSLIDLSLFIGKKVKVWGETQKAKVAGWLMDVGRVEVLQ